VSNVYSKDEIIIKTLKRLQEFCYSQEEIAKEKQLITINEYDSAKFVTTGSLTTNTTKVFFQDSVKKIIATVLDRVQNKNVIFEKLGVKNKCGILLYGPPGTGKTTLIKYLAQVLCKNIYTINLTNVQSNNKLTEAFNTVKNNNGVVVIEDMDRHIEQAFEAKNMVINETETMNEFGDTTGDYYKPFPNISKSYERSDLTFISNKSIKSEGLTIDGLMNILDGISSESGQLFIMSSNNPQVILKLNPALLRPGRIDFCIKIDFCDRKQFMEIVEYIYGFTLSAEDLEQFPLNKYPPVTIIVSFALHYVTISESARKKLSMTDLLNIVNSYDKNTVSSLIEADQ
jgi:SpoVK/Ycf46/Vps4 family AAA+-type ATPase